jgi:hypothetical protein
MNMSRNLRWVFGVVVSTFGAVAMAQSSGGSNIGSDQGSSARSTPADPDANAKAYTGTGTTPIESDSTSKSTAAKKDHNSGSTAKAKGDRTTASTDGCGAGTPGTTSKGSQNAQNEKGNTTTEKCGTPKVQ